MMTSEMGIAQTELVIDHPGGEDMNVGHDPPAPIGERGEVLIMVMVVHVAKVHIAESVEVPFTLVVQAGVPAAEKGILSMAVLVVQVRGRRGSLITTISAAQVLRERSPMVIT